MSGYYLLMHLLIAVFGNGELVLRLPSAIATVATTAIVAAIGRRLFDRRVALIAGVLTAVSLPLIFWAQSARGYAPMVAFLCGAFLIFVTVATQETIISSPARQPRVRLWVGFVVIDDTGHLLELRCGARRARAGRWPWLRDAGGRRSAPT